MRISILRQSSKREAAGGRVGRSKRHRGSGKTRRFTPELHKACFGLLWLAQPVWRVQRLRKHLSCDRGLCLHRLIGALHGSNALVRVVQVGGSFIRMGRLIESARTFGIQANRLEPLA